MDVSVDEELPEQAVAQGTGGAVPLQWSAERADGATVVRLVGELDMAAAGDVRSVLVEALDAGEDVVVDLAQLSFIDSSGLSALLWAHKRALAAGRSLTLRRVQDRVRRTMGLAQVEGVFRIEP